MDRLSCLPTELLRQILTWSSVHDLSSIRMTSKRLALLADHPSHWRHLQLTAPSNNSSSTSNLWKLEDLQLLIGPHRQLIESIHIEGVRDNVVRYILSHCVNLTDLTLYGWVTLSDHAFKSARLAPKLQRLILKGTSDQINYTALDATTLASLLIQCPLREVSLDGQVHIHAQTLLTELRKHTHHLDTPASSSSLVIKSPESLSSSLPASSVSTFNKNRLGSRRSPLQLQQLTMATRRTWSNEHVMALFDICPSLHHVCLCPADGFDLTQTKDYGSTTITQGWSSFSFCPLYPLPLSVLYIALITCIFFRYTPTLFSLLYQ